MALKKCKECGKEISNKAKECPNCGKPQGPKQYSIGKLILFILFAGFIYKMISSDINEMSSTVKSNKTPTQIAMSNTRLDYTWNKVGFDNIMEADFTISNNSKYLIKDIEITCTHFAKSGTKIDSNERIIYDVVPAKGKKTFSKFNMGFIHSQAEKTNCVITDLNI
jgi:hypothetical protein